jgi:hypothetical protein
MISHSWQNPDSSIPALISKGGTSSILMCCTTHRVVGWAARRIIGRVVSTPPFGLLLKRYLLGSLLAPWSPSEVEHSWTAGQWPRMPRSMSTPFGWCILDTRARRGQWHGQIHTIWWKHLSGAKIWFLNCLQIGHSHMRGMLENLPQSLFFLGYMFERSSLWDLPNYRVSQNWLGPNLRSFPIWNRYIIIYIIDPALLPFFQDALLYAILRHTAVTSVIRPRLPTLFLRILDPWPRRRGSLKHRLNQQVPWYMARGSACTCTTHAVFGVIDRHEWKKN